MLKRNWNFRLFWHIFVVGEISIGRGPCPRSPCLRLYSKRGKQRRCSQIFREVSGVFQQNFDCSKNSAVLEPRTGQFSRTWGFEAKAKDLRLRGQGLQNVSSSTSSRPRTFSRTSPLQKGKIFYNIFAWYLWLIRFLRWLQRFFVFFCILRVNISKGTTKSLAFFVENGGF